MRNRLADFFLIDDRARWRAILWSWLAGSIAGAIAATSTDSRDSLAFVSVGISLVTFGTFVISYGSATHRRVPIIKSRRVFIDYVYGAIAACFFVVLERILTTPETVHAAVVRIGNNIDGKTSVREDQIAAVRTALEIIAKRNPTPALKQQITFDYCVVSAASAYNIALEEISRHPSAHLIGGHFLVNSGGTFALVKDNAMFEDPDIKGLGSGSVGITIACASCSVVVLGGRFENLTQQLDFGTWFKCRFINCNISYMGGRFAMVQCEFDGCTFRFVDSVSFELRNMIEFGTAMLPMPSRLQ
jgi:hypothetical protein